MPDKKDKCHVRNAEKPPVTALQRMDFQGALISTAKDEQTGKVYCVPKEMSEHLGLNWSAQLAKLKGGVFRCGLKTMFLSTCSGVQEAVVLEYDLLLLWLQSINVSRVALPYRHALLRYQGYDVSSPGYERLLKPKTEYLYVVGYTARFPYKIGSTYSPQSRLRTLQCGCPVPLQFKYLWDVFDMRGLERTLHEKFAFAKKHGEWFLLTGRDEKALVEFVQNTPGSTLLPMAWQAVGRRK